MNETNKYITVAYKLYTTEDGEREMVEEATIEHPFQFISGLGTTLEMFENQVKNLSIGEKFDFTIPASDAYGEYEDSYVQDIPKGVFEVNGRFDYEMVAVGNVVPLMDNEGNRFNAIVEEVKEDVVVMDLNHPLAGADLNFIGEIVENREATPEEIQGMLNMMSGGGCNCDSCDCDEDHDCGGHCH